MRTPRALASHEEVYREDDMKSFVSLKYRIWQAFLKRVTVAY